MYMYHALIPLTGSRNTACSTHGDAQHTDNSRVDGPDIERLHHRGSSCMPASHTRAHHGEMARPERMQARHQPRCRQTRHQPDKQTVRRWVIAKHYWPVFSRSVSRYETGMGGFFDSFETGMVYWSMKVVWETTLILSPAREWFQRFRPLSESESDCQSRCQRIATQKQPATGRVACSLC